MEKPVFRNIMWGNPAALVWSPAIHKDKTREKLLKGEKCIWRAAQKLAQGRDRLAAATMHIKSIHTATDSPRRKVFFSYEGIRIHGCDLSFPMCQGGFLNSTILSTLSCFNLNDHYTRLLKLGGGGVHLPGSQSQDLERNMTNTQR